MNSRRAALRRFALSLPGATEDFPWGECVVKVRGKIFVFLGGDSANPPRVTVKLSEAHGHALSFEGAAPTGYGLGAHGWVTVPIAAPDLTPDVLEDWVEESYRIVAPQRLVAALDAVSRS